MTTPMDRWVTCYHCRLPRSEWETYCYWSPMVGEVDHEPTYPLWMALLSVVMFYIVIILIVMEGLT
jgi:hypothetical protein